MGVSALCDFILCPHVHIVIGTVVAGVVATGLMQRAFFPSRFAELSEHKLIGLAGVNSLRAVAVSCSLPTASDDDDTDRGEGARLIWIAANLV